MVVVIQSEAKNLEDIAQPYQWMHPRSFTALRSVLDDTTEEKKTLTNHKS